MKNTKEIEKIDVEELMNDFRIQDAEALNIYLKELWKDLSQRSDEKVKGINLVTFNAYYKLPGIILDRLFIVFDTNKNGFIDLDEFCNGMGTLFTENFDNLVKFIFNFYDFDNDGKISKEDIRTILSYVPLNTANKYKKDKMKYEKEDFKDRMESQDELNVILSNIFEKTDKLNFKEFCDIIENKSSEVFLYLIIFLLEKRPFNKKTLLAYEGLKIQQKKDGTLQIKSPTITKKLIASPSLQSKFSPSITIQKSPTISKKTIGGGLGGNKLVPEGISMLNKITGKDDTKSKLLQYTNNNIQSTSDNKDESLSKNNPIRKKMHNLKNLDDINTNSKTLTTTTTTNDNIKSPSLGPARKYQNEGLVNIQSDSSESEVDSEEVKNEGYLWKVTNNQKFKKLMFKQIDKDLYCKNFSLFLFKIIEKKEMIFIKECIIYLVLLLKKKKRL